MKKTIAFVLTIILSVTLVLPIFAKNGAKNSAEYTSSSSALDVDANSACLVEASTGKILYAKNEYEPAAPASVTKVMTLLLVCEAIEDGGISLDDKVTVSPYAASMGGSQVFLEEGERMCVEDLIKCTVIASANDAAVALAELVSGSEGAFVKSMNERAKSLGLKNTSFENVTGLDDSAKEHYSCASDIAAMSIALMKHEVIHKYTSVWQDTIRNGEFTLTNTNRLVRYYEGCNGLKTGYTDNAGYCISAAAKRGNMQLIAVIMGAETRDGRNNAARTLLDYGFANWALYERAEEFVEDVKVLRGVCESMPVYSAPFSSVVPKNKLASVEVVYEIPEEIKAPIYSDSKVGKISYMLDGETIGESDITVKSTVQEINIWQIFVRILKRVISG